VGCATQLAICDTQDYTLGQADYRPGALQVDTNPSDAKQIAVSSSPKNPASIWSLHEQTPKLTAFLIDTQRKTEPHINSVQYGCCGKTLLLTNNEKCELWDLDTKKIKCVFGASSGKAVDAQWNPHDQNCFATIAQKATEKGVVSTLTVWDIRAQEPLKFIRTDRAINKIYYDGTGSQLVATAPGQYMLCDAKNLALLRCVSLEGRKRSSDILPVSGDKVCNANALQFFSNSKDIFFAGLDDASIVGIDLAENNKQSYRFNAAEIADEIGGLAINPQQNSMATTLMFSDLVKVWDVSNAKALIDERSKQANVAKPWCNQQ
jgi:WD40 repeat protein